MSRNETQSMVYDFVRSQICECVTPLHSYVEKNVQYSLPKAVQCLSYHQQYAIIRLQWYEERTRHPDVDRYSLEARSRMCRIANEAYEKKLKLQAINELIDLGAIPVTGGNWCSSVRESGHDNWHRCSVVVDGFLYWMRHDLQWQQRKCIVNKDWEKAKSNNFNTVVKRRVGKPDALCSDPPILAMLLIAISNCFNDRDNL